MNDSTSGQGSLSIFETMTNFISRILFFFTRFIKNGGYINWIFWIVIELWNTLRYYLNHTDAFVTRELALNSPVWQFKIEQIFCYYLRSSSWTKKGYPRISKQWQTCIQSPYGGILVWELIWKCSKESRGLGFFVCHMFTVHTRIMVVADTPETKLGGFV